jgi:RHS repeat-associated protein
MELQVGSKEALYQIMLARYYSSSLGRFTSADPLNIIAFQKGDDREREVFENYILKPQTWNRYAYVENNPIDAFDPDGLASVRRRPLNFRIFHMGPNGMARDSFHQAIFFDDGSDDVGYYNDNGGEIRADSPKELSRYEIEREGLDDELMHEAVKNVEVGWKKKKYDRWNHNCQDFVAAVTSEYVRLLREQREKCGPHGCPPKPGQPTGHKEPEKPPKSGSSR